MNNIITKKVQLELRLKKYMNKQLLAFQGKHNIELESIMFSTKRLPTDQCLKIDEIKILI